MAQSHTWSDFCRIQSVSRETLERLEAYRDQLFRWQARINLIGASTQSAFWERHILDCAQLWSLHPEPADWLDIGTGAGLPGLVVATLLKGTSAHIRLVEASEKRCAFLREAIRTLDLTDQVTLIQAKIEEVNLSQLQTLPQIITARAFTSLPRLLEISKPLCGPKTHLLFPKGIGWQNELHVVTSDWTFKINTHPSLTDPEAAILDISSLSPRRVSVSELKTEGRDLT